MNGGYLFQKEGGFNVPSVGTDFHSVASVGWISPCRGGGFATIGVVTGLLTYPIRHSNLIPPLEVLFNALGAFTFVRVGASVAPAHRSGVAILLGVLFSTVAAILLIPAIGQPTFHLIWAVLACVASFAGSGFGVYRIRGSEISDFSIRSVVGDLMIGSGLVLLLATMLFGYLAWFSTSGEQGADLRDGFGRSLEPAPLPARILVVDRLWAGPWWLLFDMLGVAGGFWIARFALTIGAKLVESGQLRSRDNQ